MAETYNHELTAENLFEIQAKITRAIAAALHANLSPAEQTTIDQPLTNNLKAWEAYQRAIQLRQNITEQSSGRALIEIEHALDLDPNFAAAWSLKAIVLLQQYWFFDTDIAVRTAAWDAIERGRAINSTLAELDLAEGYYYYWGFRDYAKALPLMQKASAALPNSSRVHSARGYVLRRMGDWNATLAALSRATELDPRNNKAWEDIAETLASLGRFTQARKAISNADTQSRNFLWLMSYIDFIEGGDLKSYSHGAHLNASSYAEASYEAWLSALYLDDFETALQDVAAWPEEFLESKDSLLTRAMMLGLTHLYAGDIKTAKPLLLQARQTLEGLLEKTPQSYGITRSLCLISGGLSDIKAAKTYCKNALLVAPKDAYLVSYFQLSAAEGLALAGDNQGAIKLLQTSLANKVAVFLNHIIYHPAFDGIRAEPAYLALLDQYAPEG